MDGGVDCRFAFSGFCMEKQELLHHLINAYAEAYQNLGHSSLMGKIVALLIASPEPLSLDDISAQLQMSKGPVSQIARKLKEHRLIEKVWIPGERRDFYRAADDIFGQAFANYAASMKRNKQIAADFEQQIGDFEHQDAQTRHLLARMQEMKTFYEAMEAHNRAFLESWQQHIRPGLTPLPDTQTTSDKS